MLTKCPNKLDLKHRKAQIFDDFKTCCCPCLSYHAHPGCHCYYFPANQAKLFILVQNSIHAFYPQRINRSGKLKKETVTPNIYLRSGKNQAITRQKRPTSAFRYCRILPPETVCTEYHLPIHEYFRQSFRTAGPL